MAESNELAVKRTQMANQRTYLAYMRTGFAIAGVAGAFKKLWIVLFGIIMIIGSSFQYIIISDQLKTGKLVESEILNNLPLIYTALSLAVLYLQFIKKKKYI